MYQLRICMKGLLDTVDAIAGFCVVINGKRHLYKKEFCDLTTQQNYRELRDNLANEMEEVPLEYTKQRSPAWFKLRETVKVTGSVAHDSIGLNTLKAQKDYFDSKLSPPKRNETVTESAKQAMEHGARNEINATATLVGKVMPVYYPDFEFHEEGAYLIRNENGKKIMIISPDGTIRNDKRIVSIEIKCPFSSFVGSTPVFYEVKPRHVVQCLLEAHATQADEHLYISWSKESTTVFRMKPHCDLVNSVIQEVDEVYYSSVPVRPTRISARAKSLKMKIREVIDDVEFLGEFPSITAHSSARKHQSDVQNVYILPEKDEFFVNHAVSDTNELMETAHKATKLMTEAYQSQKPAASEVLVYLLSDMNRLWHPEIGHGLPIAYLYKGYSLSMGTSRRILDLVLNACKDCNIHVPCITFDGQFFKIERL